MERKLASIRVIKDLSPIAGADAIECATIDGWKVVVKKGEFKVGDFCVYFEIDSFLPIRSEFEFLRKSSYKNHPTLGEGFRLKTIKLRGQVSQGLALPLHVLFKQHPAPGADVTETLGVKKYEAPIPVELAGQVEGPFPSFIPKTDQERIQNLFGTSEYEEHEYDQFELTIKLDGTSMTVFCKDGNVGVCSRNYQLKINEENKDNAFIRAMRMLNVDQALCDMKMNVAVQGELMGPGIQGNREKLDRFALFVFDVFLIDEQRYMHALERRDFVTRLRMMGALVQEVPVIGFIGTMQSIEEYLEAAEGPSYNPGVEREGVVYKSLEDPSFSFKVISNKYLLKHEQ